MNLIVQRLMDEPWAITPAALEVILGVAEREIDLAGQLRQGIPLDKLFHTDALMARPGARLEGTQRTVLRGNTAVIPVYGPIFPRANMMTEVSGATSTEMVAYDFSKVMADPNVAAVLFSIDSPGGAVTNVAELSDLIYQSRGRKPVRAHISGLGASAVFWLASATERVIVAQTAEVGSVGVVAAFRDTRGAEEKAGIKSVEIVSSISPLKRVSLDSEAGQAKVQRIVDAVADVFVSHLARNRGVTTEKVLSDFGRGDLFVGARAVEAGMADAVGTFEDALNMIEAECGGNKKRKRKEMGMAGQEQEQVLKMTAEAVRETQSEAAAQIAEQGRTEGFKAGVEAERARIQAIMALPVTGCAKLITEAIADSTMTAEKMAVKILQEQQQNGKDAADRAARDAAALGQQAAGLGAPPANLSGVDAEEAERKAKAAKIAAGANQRRGILGAD